MGAVGVAEVILSLNYELKIVGPLCILAVRDHLDEV